MLRKLAAYRRQNQARPRTPGAGALARTRYDDGGFSGGNLERPGLQQLIADIRGRIDIVVVYKVDRLTHSLADFAQLIELFYAEGVS
jgi:site-specific DNA recombinase